MFCEEGGKPLPAGSAVAGGEGELGVGRDAGEEESGSIAEGLREVAAEAVVVDGRVSGVEAGFGEFGGPAEIAAGASAEFGPEEAGPGFAGGCAEADPGEVEEFVDEDAAVLGAVAKEGGVEDDAALADERGGVDFNAGSGAMVEFAARGAETGQILDGERSAGEVGHAHGV
jgi:hypothetical protein